MNNNWYTQYLAGRYDLTIEQAETLCKMVFEEPLTPELQAYMKDKYSVSVTDTIELVVDWIKENGNVQPSK